MGRPAVFVDRLTTIEKRHFVALPQPELRLVNIQTASGHAVLRRQSFLSFVVLDRPTLKANRGRCRVVQLHPIGALGFNLVDYQIERLGMRGGSDKSSCKCHSECRNDYAAKSHLAGHTKAFSVRETSCAHSGAQTDVQELKTTC